MSYDPGDPSDYEAKGRWYPSEKQALQKLMKRGPDPGRGDDPLWCVACQKRFNSHGVFKGHLMGKKHIGALRKAGKHTEADGLKELAKTTKAKDELAKAQETATVKRSRPALPGGADMHATSERDKKVAKACFEPGGEGARAASASAPNEAPASEAAASPTQLAVAGVATQPMPASAPNGEPHLCRGPQLRAGIVMDSASQCSPFLLPPSTGIEWWKGVPTIEKDDGPEQHMSALERLIAKNQCG